jgi:putative aldouronate transport system substrate-binding protein
MTSGYSMATYAYYDQIGGLEAASEIEGYDLQMYAPLAGPVGAHHQPKSRVSAGIMFPITTAEREDFEQVVRAVDKMFYSEEAAMIWHIGVEGVTYNMVDGKIEFIDEIKNAEAGIFKYMQVKYGCGADPFQMVWLNDIDFLKYDEFYANLNAEVAAMDEAIQGVAPAPWFDDIEAEEAATIQAGLIDPVEIWIDAFVTGKKDIDSDADWAEYIAELEALGARELFEIYNENRNRG